MITEKAIYYLVYAVLVVITFVIDMMLLKKTDKTSRTIGYILSIIVDLAMFGFGIWLYKVKGEDQTGFVLGGILCGVCLLCLLGRYWQNKEADKRDKRSREKQMSSHWLSLPPWCAASPSSQEHGNGSTRPPKTMAC